MAVAPSISNYYIGKGNVYIKPPGSPDELIYYYHLGNCPKFSVTPQNTIKEHFSVVGGVGVVDFVSITQKTVDVTISAEEFTTENLAIALGATSGIVHPVVNEWTVRFSGSNTIGQKAVIYIPHVLFTVDAEVDFITDDWGTLELTGRAIYTPAIGGFMVATMM